MFSPGTRVFIVLGPLYPSSTYMYPGWPGGRSLTSINDESTFLLFDTITLRSSSRRAIPVYHIVMCTLYLQFSSSAQ